jgi:mycothiol system anti-sigma-R factor
MGAPMGFGPGGIDCNDVLDEVFLYLDEETDPGLRERIRQHLDACSPCFKRYGLEQDVKALVARCCGGDVAPSHLRENIRVRLTQITVETTTVEFRAD